MLKENLGFIPVICLDAGHGEDTPGKRTPPFDNGIQIREHQFNQAVVDILGKKLTQYGFETIDVANEDSDVALSTRVDRANSIYKQQLEKYPEIKEAIVIYISVHYNAQDSKWGGTVGGIETYFYPSSEQGEKLAALVQKELIKRTPQRNRGIKAANFFVLRKTLMPAILVEAGFMDYKPEAKLMLNKEFQEEVASEIYKGILNFYSLDSYSYDTLREENTYLKKELEKYKNKFKELRKAFNVLNKLLGG